MISNLSKPEHGFSNAEYELRLQKAHKKMEESKLDALLITTPHNFRYFTGFDSYFWESPTRPWFLIIPNNKDIIAAVPSIGVKALRKTWIKHIHTWASPNPKDEGISLLAGIINDINNRYKNIGVEMGNESTLRMPLRDFFDLQKKVTKFNFIDGSKLLWELRILKSGDEIKKLKYICKIASDAYENLPNIININETERTICNKLKTDLISRGADHTIFMACSSGEIGYDQIIFEPSENILKNGNILFIDTGSTFDGYFCDFDRNYAFGSINKEVEKAYTASWNAVTKGIEAAKPGKTFSDIFIAMNKVLEEAGSVGNEVG